MQKEIIVKKNFLNLFKGDIITITIDGDGRIYFYVENRTAKKRFWGNEKGLWGRENPYKKDTPEFKLIDEPIGRKRVLDFGAMPLTEPHPTDKMRFADNSKSTEDWIAKILNDLRLIGVI